MANFSIQMIKLRLFPKIIFTLYTFLVKVGNTDLVLLRKGCRSQRNDGRQRAAKPLGHVRNLLLLRLAAMCTVVENA